MLSEKGLIAKIHKECLHSIAKKKKKKNHLIKKGGERLSTDISAKEIYKWSRSV